MALPSQAPRSMVGARRQMMSRKKSRPGPTAVVAVLGVCGLALAYVVVRPLFVAPNRAGAEGPSPAPEVREPTPGGAPITTGRTGTSGGSSPVAPTARQGGASVPSLEGLVSDARREAAPVTLNQGSGRPTLAVVPPPAGEAADERGADEPAGRAPAGASTVAPSAIVGEALRAAQREREGNRPVAARDVLLRAFERDDLTSSDRSRLREEITGLNAEIIFSPRVFAGDSFTGEYQVQSGDSLSRIASRQGLGVDWRLIQRVNGMTSENIRVGQRLKVVRGPFHAVVDKSDYRLDLFAGPPDEREEWVYVRSFPVGLGEGDGTPVGEFIVKRNSRLINPVWVNPRTRERFDANDPLNPIGERWIGLRGLGDSAVHESYGLHGTIDPGSIGQQKSMGCVRLLGPDIELVYELMAEEISRVFIEP